jgi:Flp pilus assembly pilin Flp
LLRRRRSIGRPPSSPFAISITMGSPTCTAGKARPRRQSLRGQGLLSFLQRIVRNLPGVTATLYALIVFLIGTAAIGAMTTFVLSLVDLAGPIGNASN